MARIRSLKPTFWTDEKLGLISRGARYTFIGLISAMADDHGRLSGNVRIIRGAVYPFDDDISSSDVSAHLEELHHAGRIVRYAVNGDDYIYVRHWSRHQRVDRPNLSLIPEPPSDLVEPNEGQTDHSTNVRRMVAESSTTNPAGEEGSGTGSGKEREQEQRPPAPPLALAPTRVAPVTAADRAVLLEAFPKLADALPPSDGRDVLLELAVWAPDKAAYLGEASAALDGMHGVLLAPAQVRTAITDWLANREKPNLRRFRGYLKGAQPLERPPPRPRASTTGERPGIGARAFATTLGAIEDM